MILRFTAIVIFTSAFVGCAGSLTREGERVSLVYSAPTDIKAFEPMGILTCQKEINLAKEETNKKSCEMQLRNEAGEKGADLVLVESYDTFPGTATIGVSIITQMYRRN
ncbi:MAG: hypothetical protein KDD22_08130 [Bdellovibrionales bacterium]|nr:hypothetical protein [Bdellovibrionales bacterium]